MNAFLKNKQCLQWSQRLMSLTNDDIVWYDSALISLDIIDSCGEFSNVPIIGTQGGVNTTLEINIRAWSVQLCSFEAYTIWAKKRDLELKMPYAYERPISLVVDEPSTLPNQDVKELEDALIRMKKEIDMWEERFHALSRKHEELQLETKDKDALIEILEERAVKRQRDPDGLYSSSMP
ncbi:hypothetical protein KIW84_055039 [Lathyrus oleraceus]|uniref:DUF7745 domain-containing protein n=1 Tax=Pisum sativum TaxID=3888 RepID=A0A9D5AJ99_PEA|nr:hypothetical protein KIW84_055039 [Pisum sativum]